jgi:hypothetical protein
MHYNLTLIGHLWVDFSMEIIGDNGNLLDIYLYPELTKPGKVDN